MEKITDARAEISGLFGSMVFGDAVMKDRLPREIYKKLRSTIDRGEAIDPDIANVVSSAMKNWALEKGATHYTHWFQPMTGITAEKHDSFITPEKDGGIRLHFPGRELIRGEPDASSLPSGGLRATFEARGYTAWDPTSYAFIKDGVLCIPTAYCSYSGEALDKKTPLMRSALAISRQALRILRLFGNTAVNRVLPTSGVEQEYFLIDRAMYDRRPDLRLCGRTLYGARSSKGQELSGHYFGAIKPRVQEFMNELNRELWKLAIYAKTEHNETAPAQHELAPVFTTANTAVDHNQLTMEMMKKVAQRHGLACLLHEKPFQGINGSGKHTNWSLMTDAGANLLEPGDSPQDNAQFLLFLVAVIKAVDEYQDLLRVSAATAGNDHRLGGYEAPPAIISVHLGDQLDDVIASIADGRPRAGHSSEPLRINVDMLPDLPRDSTDRNRTSPFAFTGNKFEFRMPGSASSVSGPNFVINTIVAESLMQFADRLERAQDFTAELSALISDTIRAHRRIIYSGNSYSDEWTAEAARRGLLNLRSTNEALPHFTTDKNIALFERHGVLSAAEIRARCGILTEEYCKIIHSEALTMLDMFRRDIMPAVCACQSDLCTLALGKRSLGGELPSVPEHRLLEKMSALAVSASDSADALQAALLSQQGGDDMQARADHMRLAVFPLMQELRAAVDELETMTGAKYWPYPTYSDMLFSV